MRIEWGGRNNEVRLGPPVTRPCASCRRHQSFIPVLRYRVSYFGDPALCWVSRRDHASVCDACGWGGDVDAPAEGGRKNDPIPWKDRYGMAVGGLAIIFMMLFFGRLIGCLSEVPKH